MKLYRIGAGCAVAAAAMSYALAQTQIDLRTQAKRVDFSNASSTKPSKTGTVLPATCDVGETFLKTDATPGANWYVCTAPNVWTVQGGALPDYGAEGYGKVLTNDGAGIGWESLGGDVSGAPDALTVNKLQGRPLASTAPSIGHLLTWDGAQWIPQPFQLPALSGDVTSSAGSTVTTLNAVNPSPGSCGDATHVCQLTTNAKGLVTQQTSVAVAASGAGIGSLNGLTGASQNFANDTNVTVTSAGATHTLGWTGLLGLPRGGVNADLSGTGGAHQVLRQSSAGAPVSVGQLAAGDISGLAASATTDATNAANISSGTLPNGRLASVPNSALANSSITVSAGNGLSGGGTAALGGSISLNSALTINRQTGISYTLAAGDEGKLVTFNNAAATSVTMPQATGSFGIGWYVRVRNLGAGAVTITPATSTIDGGGSLMLQAGQGAEIASDGVNYQVWKGFTWQASVAGSHQFATGLSAAGVVLYGQPAAADITGLAASATTDATNATNIGSGTLNAARLPQFSGGDVTTALAGSTNLTIGAGRVTNVMLGGSIATSKLASLQGTDGNVMTAGTVSGVGAALCTDSNGGATTSGCTGGAGTVSVAGGGSLTSTALVTGGGAQAVQTPAAAATMDASGNIRTPGTISAGNSGSNAGSWAFVQGTATSAPANSVGFQAPASVPTGYRINLPSAPADGFVKRTSANPSLESVGAISGADLPNPGASSKGGVLSVDCGGQFVQKINTDGTVTCAISLGYPSPGIPNSSGNSWAASYTVGTGANNIPQLDATGKLNLAVIPIAGGISNNAAGATPTWALVNGDASWTLSGNATATVMVASGDTWRPRTIRVCQPATGGPYTLTWPSNVHGGMVVGTVAGLCSVQSFESFDGVMLYATSAGVVNQ